MVIDNEVASCIRDAEKIEALVHRTNLFYFEEGALLEHSSLVYFSCHQKNLNSSFPSLINYLHYLMT